MIRHRTLMLDVGGTFIKCSDGRTVPIDSDGSREDIVSSLHLALQATHEYDRVAVAVPGPFDYVSGVFRMDHKFASVKGECFSTLAMGDAAGSAPGRDAGSGPVLSSVSCPVASTVSCPAAASVVEFRYMHDVNCMLLGEMTHGNARGYRNAALVSLGTGLGFSICREGELLCNEAGSPAISVFGLPYRDGILEDYVSKRGFLRGWGDGMTVKGLACLAKDGDAAALERFVEVGHIIGSSVAGILEENGIECLLFGGQISRSFGLMSAAVCEELSGVSSLSHIGAISDFDNATFNGLRSLWGD